LALLAVPGKPSVSCLLESGLAGFADHPAAAFVLVVGGDIPHALVQPHRVVVDLLDGQLGAQLGECRRSRISLPGSREVHGIP
jgi:hypothetical protein